MKFVSLVIKPNLHTHSGNLSANFHPGQAGQPLMMTVNDNEKRLKDFSQR